MRLPIDAMREQIAATFASPRPLIVTAETGSGKSTRVPLWLWQELGHDVIVVQPRRVACRSVAEFVASELREKVGQTVGYTVRFDDKTSGSTRIRFVTTGIAVRMLESGRLPPIVVMDEFHERRWELDLLLTRLIGSASHKLVLLSATLDAAALAERLDAQHVHASGRTFPVTVTYDDSPAMPSERDLATRVAAGVRRATETTPGDVLVFLPGMREIRDAQAALQGAGWAKGMAIEVLHGSLPPERTQGLFRPAKQRRVILSTNVAETSVTIPTVTAVVDSGLARERIHRGGRSALAVVGIAQSSMDQRAGRAGRVAAGACVRLWSERHRADAFAAPEILRVPLDDMMLQAARSGLHPKDWDTAPWLDPPPAFAVEEARGRLQALGAVDDEGVLTEAGAQLGGLPIGAHEAAALVNVPSKLAADVADMVAAQQVRGRWFGPGTADQIDARKTLLVGCRDELQETVRILRHADAHKHCISRSRLRECRRIADALRALVGCNSLRSSGGPNAKDFGTIDSRAVAQWLLSSVPDCGYVLRKRARKGGDRAGRSQPWSNGTSEVWVDPYVAMNPQDRTDKPTTAGVLLSVEWLGQGGTQVRGVGRGLIPCRESDFAAAGLCDTTVTKVLVRKNRGSKRIVGRVQSSYAGVQFDEEDRPLTGADLRTACAQLILDGRLLAPAGDRIQDLWHLWGLLLAFNGQNELPQIQPMQLDLEPYLVDRLQKLGLESSSELELLEPDDIAPPIEELFQVSGWRVEKLLVDYPRTWEHLGGLYRVDVRPRSRRVILEPINKSAKNQADPSAKVLPRFGGFRVDFRKASRTITLRK